MDCPIKPFNASLGEAQYDRAEEPLFVTENNLPIDTNHYLDSIKTTLLRIFEVVMPNPQTLFSKIFMPFLYQLFAIHSVLINRAGGEHTRVINISSNTGGLMNKFLTKVNRCLSCNIVIKSSTFCDNCNQSKKQQVRPRPNDNLRFCWTSCGFAA